jgi:hypothetical protein
LVCVPERRVDGPWPTNWTRIEIDIPNTNTSAYSKPKKIYNWITKNLGGRWGAYEYVITNTGDVEYKTIIYFEKRNDAIMFKLNGSKAWEL